MVTNLRGTYEERLATLKMRAVEDRRVRGNLIKTFKILSGKRSLFPDLTSILGSLWQRKNGE